MLKIGSWLVGFGCFLAAAGLCFLPAAFGTHPDSSMWSAGAMLFCLGTVMVTCGMYVKARHWAALAPANASPDAKRGRKVCEMCAKNEAVIQCRVHQMQLCANCVSAHYDFRSCAYVPSTRQTNSKARAQSQSVGR